MADDKKPVIIFVNTVAHEWPRGSKITYAEVVKFDDPNYNPNSGVTYLVKYKNGKGEKPEGILAPDASVEVKDDMRFTVSKTGQS